MPGEYTLILVDGKRQSTRETMNRGTGGVQSNLIPPPEAIERIEVVRGPMSSLYGSDAMGGVINILTRKIPKTWSGSLSLKAVVPQDSDEGDTRQAGFWLGDPIKTDSVGLQSTASSATATKTASTTPARSPAAPSARPTATSPRSCR